MKTKNCLLHRIFMASLCMFICNAVEAQRKDCGTHSPVVRIHPDTISARLMRSEATYPLLMKVFVHIIANDNGTNVAAGDSSIMRQMENMQQFYSPHGICFILAGYEQINSTDLNFHNADTEEAELSPFLIADMMNLFIHDTLFNNDGGLNGVAYSIPGTKLSMGRVAVISTENRSTMAHEVGHCFGLYHTFESRTVSGNEVFENAARSGGCRNCTTEGDLLCDTDADRDIDANLINATTCNYTGNATDACDDPIPMTPTNIMTYGRRLCRSVFTTGQANRCEAFIITTPALTDAIAPDNLTLSVNFSITSGRRNYLARNVVSVTASSASVSGTAMVNFGAAEVVLPPGVSFFPSGNGYTVVRANTLCQ